jgi:cytoplasmic iron level regulating protein YaaA (DUF328/UPF0246 family)
MLLVISPAKTLDYSSPQATSFTLPDFPTEIKDLVGVLKKKSAPQLAELMHLSEPLAALNEERYQSFTDTFTPENAKQALMAFKGDVYTMMDVAEYSEADLAFAQQHLRILSGLYGLLKPLDLIQPYRLEMGTRLKTTKGDSLYAYWGSKISKALNEAGKGQTLVNLASQEYFKAVDQKTLSLPVVNIHFKEFKDGKYQVLGLFAKQARGRMSNFVIKNRLTDPEQLKTFHEAGYEFAERLSSATDWVFVR